MDYLRNGNNKLKKEDSLILKKQLFKELKILKANARY